MLKFDISGWFFFDYNFFFLIGYFNFVFFFQNEMAMVLKYCSVLLVYTCMSWNLTFLGDFSFDYIFFVADRIFQFCTFFSRMKFFSEWNAEFYTCACWEYWHIVFDWKFQPFFSKKKSKNEMISSVRVQTCVWFTETGADQRLFISSGDVVMTDGQFDLSLFTIRLPWRVFYFAFTNAFQCCRHAWFDQYWRVRWYWHLILNFKSWFKERFVDFIEWN